MVSIVSLILQNAIAHYTAYFTTISGAALDKKFLQTAVFPEISVDIIIDIIYNIANKAMALLNNGF